jgi:hypothetical protein
VFHTYREARNETWKCRIASRFFIISIPFTVDLEPLAAGSSVGVRSSERNDPLSDTPFEGIAFGRQGSCSLPAYGTNSHLLVKRRHPGQVRTCWAYTAMHAASEIPQFVMVARHG